MDMTATYPPSKSTTELIVRFQKAKFVQPNLAVAQGRVQSCHNQTLHKEEEPCQISLCSRTDVDQLKRYLNAYYENNNENVKRSTGKWWALNDGDESEEDPIYLVIETPLTTKTERNRHGVKLIDCQELIRIERNTEDCINKTIPHYSSRDEVPLNNEFVMHDKSKRHELFADWLIDVYGKEWLSKGSGILDVAGGKGELSHALLERGIPSVVLDPLPRLRKDDQSTILVIKRALEGVKLLQEASMEEQELITTCSMIVGLHPDQATEPIILLAQHLKVDFAMLPCCVMPSLFPKRMHQGQPVRSYRIFCQYLLALQNDTKTTQVDYLPFMGRNMILYSVQREESKAS